MINLSRSVLDICSWLFAIDTQSYCFLVSWPGMSLFMVPFFISRNERNFLMKTMKISSSLLLTAPAHHKSCEIEVSFSDRKHFSNAL